VARLVVITHPHHPPTGTVAPGFRWVVQLDSEDPLSWRDTSVNAGWEPSRPEAELAGQWIAYSVAQALARLGIAGTVEQIDLDSDPLPPEDPWPPSD
jgi:hypothetical protein